jgi:hypothetical protein
VSFLAATLLATLLMLRPGPYRYLPGQPEGNDQIVTARAEN